jgi:hypothetical protein
MQPRRLLAAALAALLGAGCAPRDADWAAAYLERGPLSHEAGEAFRKLLPGVTPAQVPVLRVRPTFMEMY